jgi:hypothetical protein
MLEHLATIASSAANFVKPRMLSAFIEPDISIDDIL